MIECVWYLYNIQLKVYALLKSVATPIDNAYEAKAEKVDTLTKYHQDHSSYSGYIFFNFLCFPVISWIILVYIFYYINSSSPEPRIAEIRATLKGNNANKISECKFRLQDDLILSLTFVVYSVCLSSVAVSFSVTKVHEETKKYFSYGSDVPVNLKLIYALAHILVGQDAIILISMVSIIIAYQGYYFVRNLISLVYPKKNLKSSVIKLKKTAENFRLQTLTESPDISEEATDLRNAATELEKVQLIQLTTTITAATMAKAELTKIVQMFSEGYKEIEIELDLISQS